MRASRAFALAGGALLLAAVAAAWLLPPRLDWNGYRGRIEVIASAALGRPVTITGPIALSLLPEPVMTAGGVEVAAQAGVALAVKALRLRIALAPLLAGRIAPRELVLRQPELRLAWPLPNFAGLRAPAWLGGFSARVEDGRIAIGDLSVDAVDATFMGTEEGGVTLSGTARTAALSGHFTARLTSPGGDGAQGLDIALDGSGQAVGTGASFSGRIAPDGSLDGRLVGRGPSLAMLPAAPPLPFRLEARLTASDRIVAADDLLLEIGGVPAQGAASLRLRPAMRADIALAAGQVDLAPWVGMLRGALGATLPLGIDLSVEAARLGGATMRRLRFSLASQPGDAPRLRSLTVLLPDDAMLSMSGQFVPTPGGTAFDGDATLAGADLRSVVLWLGRLGGADAVKLPADMLRDASLRAHVVAAPPRFSLADLRGKVAGSEIQGSLALAAGEPVGRPAVIDADLRIERLTLDPLFPADTPWRGAWPRLDGSLTLVCPHATFRGTPLEGLSAEIAGEGGAVRLRRLSFTAGGARVTAAGSLSAARQVSGAALTVGTDEAAGLAPLLPEAGRRFAPLLRGPLSLRIGADGPPNALALAVELGVAEGRLEAQPVLDLDRRSVRGPASFRFPGAGRWLAETGLLEDPSWLGEGSLSLAGQFSLSPAELAARGFELSAGGLRAAGSLVLDRSGGVSALSGQVAAETLPVPFAGGVDAALLAWRALLPYRASVRLTADQVSAGLGVLLKQAAATVTLQDGHLRLEPFSASLAGGLLGGTVQLDLAPAQPVLTIDGAVTDARLDPAPAAAAGDLPLSVAGLADLHVRGTARGFGLNALLATASGHADLTVRDGTLQGIDLAAIRRVLAAASTPAGRADPNNGEAPPAAAAAATVTSRMAAGRWADIRPTLAASLAGGATPLRSFGATATLREGTLVLDAARMDAADGAIDVTGTMALPAGDLNLLAAIRPRLPAPPVIGLRVGGTLDAPRTVPELAGVAEWLAGLPAQ